MRAEVFTTQSGLGELVILRERKAPVAVEALKKFASDENLSKLYATSATSSAVGAFLGLDFSS